MKFKRVCILKIVIFNDFFYCGDLIKACTPCDFSRGDFQFHGDFSKNIIRKKFCVHSIVAKRHILNFGFF